MGIFDRMSGREPSAESSPDDQALQRYRYLMRTAPPEAIEETHREAFARLTPEQRAQVLRELNSAVPASERASEVTEADPKTLARMATRAELRQPGILERTLARGPSLGGMFASSLFGSIVGSVIGSAIAHQLFSGFAAPIADSGSEMASSDEAADDDTDPGTDEADTDDVGGDFGDDIGSGIGD